MLFQLKMTSLVVSLLLVSLLPAPTSSREANNNLSVIPWIGRGGSRNTDTSSVTDKPSWLQMDHDTLQQYMELAKQRHADAVKAAEDSYFSASSTISDDARTTHATETLPPVQSFGIAAPPTWSLPDFAENFNLEKVIYVTTSPLFSQQECNQVISDAEEYFAKEHGGEWTTLPSGQYDVAGFWIKSVPAVHEWFNTAVRTKLFPLVQRQFPHFCNEDDLVVDNAYVFKYTTETGRRTDVHTDSGCLSFTIALNANDDYSGGGTWFESLHKHDNSLSNTVEMDQGMVTVRPGGVRHCGQAVTSGTRYIIGGFCMHRNKVEYVRMLIGLGAERASQGDYEGAEEAYMAALSLNSKFDATYPNLASVLEEQEKAQQAKQVLEYCYHHVNSRNAEVAYSLGILYLDSGEYDKCKECMNTCLETDACDTEAMMVMAQACAAEGNRAGEEEWYRRITETSGVTNDKAASAFCNLGVMKEGTEEEFLLYEQGLELAPNHFQLRYSLGSALALKKQFEDAAKHFRVAVQASADNPEQQSKAVQLLYRAAVMAVQNDESSRPASQEALIERLQNVMGKENYEMVAAMSRKQ